MSVFNLSDFADHEQVVFCSDEKSGLKAIIAVHNSNLGPALGGCRMWPYASEEEAIRDVLRLSRGMTYKSAMANLKLGGGKSVIIGNPRTDKTPELLKAFAQAVERVNGRYIAAEDSGTGVDDMKFMSQFTQHVAGIVDKPSENGTRSGDPSPATAYGTFVGIKAAVKERLGRDSLEGLKIAVQGLGNVGFDLARQLKEAGAQLWVTDIHREPLIRAGKELEATVVAPDEIFGLDVDVFAPCAMGAIINDQTLPQLKAKIAKAKREIQAEKKAGKKGRGIRIPRQGAGTAVLLGGPNAGKSQLLASLTRATPEIAPYPFTTHLPAPGMMPWEDVTVQLIDTPPITRDVLDPNTQGLIRGAELVLLLADLANDALVEDVQAVVDHLNQTQTRLAKESYVDEQDVGLVFTQTFLVLNKIDAPDAAARVELLHEFCSYEFREFTISAQHGNGLETLRDAIYGAMNVVRVYTKLPTEKPSRSGSIHPVSWRISSPAAIARRPLRR